MTMFIFVWPHDVFGCKPLASEGEKNLGAGKIYAIVGWLNIS